MKNDSLRVRIDTVDAGQLNNLLDSHALFSGKSKSTGSPSGLPPTERVDFDFESVPATDKWILKFLFFFSTRSR